MRYTIFTPTYNRAHLLPKLYNSIVAQQSRNFEWLIIDDGSVDNTEEVVQSFISKGDINIRYIKQKNGGKHTAFNRAIEEANSEWFVCIDSDDPLVPEAIENMDKGIAMIEGKEDVAGIVGVCVTPAGERLGYVPGEYLYSNTIECRDKYHLQCEPEVYKLSLLKQYRFPEFEGEKFITEAIVFDRLTEFHPLLYTNFPMQVKEYLAGGLTDNQLKIRVNSPNGTLAYYKQRYQMTKIWKYKIKALVNYSRFYIHAKKNKSVLKEPLYKKSLWIFPIGYLMYLKDKNS